jgi:hypothetical protein
LKWLPIEVRTPGNAFFVKVELKTAADRVIGSPKWRKPSKKEPLFGQMKIAGTKIFYIYILLYSSSI